MSGRHQIQRTKINPISKRRAKQRRVYRNAKDGGKQAKYLADHPFCEIALTGVLGEPTHRQSTQIHHKLGCVGEDLNDERFFCASSQEGHAWAELNRTAARALGFLITRDRKAQKAQGIR
jgi:hypothetical protein